MEKNEEKESKKKIRLLKPGINNFDLFTERTREIFETGWITNDGPFLRRFEQDTTAYLNTPSIAVANGTMALMLALRGLKLRGNVIIPSFTFCATAHAVVWAGLEPNFVDIDQETFTINPENVREAINDDTSAILAVHVFGNPCKIAELTGIAREHNLVLLFDAAHAFGSTYRGQKIGCFGQAEIFSTHATKLFISGEGGIITTRDERLRDYLQKARNFGLVTNEDSAFIGTNAKLSELHAIIGLDSLTEIDRAISKRHQLAKQYKSELALIPGISFQKIEEQGESNYFYFTILVDQVLYGMNRDKLANFLAEKGIETRKYFYLPLHQQMAYRKLGRLSLPHTEYVASNILCLPTHSGLSLEDVSYICNSIKEAHKNKKAYLSESETSSGSNCFAGQEAGFAGIPNNYPTKKVLITGGAGYIGCVLVPKLLEKGYQTIVLDQLIFGKESLAPFINHPNFDLQIGQVEDKYMVEKCLEGVDAVIHLAGLSNDPSCEINAELTRKANIDATKVLLDLSRAKRVKRFIFASSCSIYGFTEGRIVTEESLPNPLTTYAKSKAECEKLILSEASGNFVTTCLRKATAYGPSPRMRFDLVINTMTGMGLSEGRIIINGGEQWRPFLHVEDAADAYLFMLEADTGKINGQVFNVGSNEQNIKILDLANRIANHLPGVKIDLSPSPDNRSYLASFDKINSLGWRAKRTIEEGVEGIKKLFEEGKVKDFRDLNYFNIKRMITYLNV